MNFYEPSRLQLSESTPQSDKLSLSESRTVVTATVVPRPPMDNPRSTLSHIAAEQPLSQSGHESSGPIGKQVAWTDHGLHIPEVKCRFLKLFTRFSAFSALLFCSSVDLTKVLSFSTTGKDKMKFGWGRDARTRRKSGSKRGNSGGDSTLKNERYDTSSEGDIDWVAKSVKTSKAACCKSE